MQEHYVPEVLTIAGSDSGGGAGLQADIKTFQAHHVYSTNVIVGITAQNTLDVQDSLPLSSEIINQQFKSISDDFEIKASKTGALFDKERVLTVVKNIDFYNLHPLVVDPVMIAKGGTPLLNDDGIKAVINTLIPRADVFTPNLPEAETIIGHKISTESETKEALKIIQSMGAKNVIIKGGHSDKAKLTDYVLLQNGEKIDIVSKKYNTRRKHGTGDTLSSAITANLAKGKNVKDSIRLAKDFIDTIIPKPILVGHGHGPLNHWGAEN